MTSFNIPEVELFKADYVDLIRTANTLQRRNDLITQISLDARREGFTEEEISEIRAWLLLEFRKRRGSLGRKEPLRGVRAIKGME